MGTNVTTSVKKRRLSESELEVARVLLGTVRNQLEKVADNDTELLFLLRRKVAKELVYDERSKPAIRKRLKTKKRTEQNGLCAQCNEPLPDSDCVLDRFVASAGYTIENTQLICRPCDNAIQQARKYT